MPAPFHFSLLIHAHQPAGNFESVQEEVYRVSYLPFLEMLAQHPRIRIAFHYSGVLLEWVEKRHPEYIERLRELIARGQVELVGGGFYEPVLSAIPDRDRLAQMEKYSDWLEARFGRRPRGMWLTERVWDPSLPRSLSQAGIAYTLTDDYHFLSAGLEEAQLCGYYLTEWQGSVVKVVPGLKKLRYLLPFRMENECIAFLRRSAEEHPGGLAAMGDDLEKFGAWPETHQHVYINGWLRRFFEAVEASSDWLSMELLGEFVEKQPPLGRIYLPTASYQEMMGWALPPGAGDEYEGLLRHVAELPRGDRLVRFVHGGVWHNFFHKYEEANHLHKRMLEVSRRYTELDRALPAAGESRQRFSRGYDSLLRAQCNDAYWHGVFGGLYTPHLRTAVYQALIEAENTADALDPGRPPVRRFDLNVDGRDEIMLANESLSAIVNIGDGGTVSEIAYRPLAFNAVNSLRRRTESYHARLRDAGRHSGGAKSIHDRVVVKEQGLENHLLYDRYNRHVFRSLVFSTSRTIEDYRSGRLEESVDLAGGVFDIARVDGHGCVLTGRAPGCLAEVRNEIRLEGNALIATWQLRHGALAELRGGLELVLNLLAPSAHDRYFVLPQGRPRLAWSGEVQAECLALVDEWLNLRIEVSAQPAATWWICPIFTVSQSEGGFEKVYQGSSLLPHWPAAGGELRATVRLEFGPAR